MITADLVKSLRDKTGAGMMECKKALETSGGDLEGAVDILRQKGMATARKKAERAASACETLGPSMPSASRARLGRRGSGR